jgi:hypothetical protein
MSDRRADLDAFYQRLDELRGRLGGFRYLKDCTRQSGWPSRGVYFFFDHSELREDGTTLRVVRVGTHAVSATSRTTLWHRLRTHRGSRALGGNHRGSIFRKRVGEALLRSGSYPESIHQTWGKGSTAPREVCVIEYPLEREVSEYVGRLPFLWISVDDDPCPRSQRALIERNSIALLSNFNKATIDPPSKHWLGLKASEMTIRESGLWNTNHVDDQYDRSFLSALEVFINRMIAT